MNNFYHIVVCAGLIPDPLQTLEPISNPAGPTLKNEMLLPAVLDPWAAHALYEASHLASHAAGSKVWLVSIAPKAKLQQVMMNIAQKTSFELVPVDAPANGFADAHAISDLLSKAITEITGLDRSRLLLFGGWESAARSAGITLQLVGEQLGILDQFQGVDRIAAQSDGRFEILERIEGGRHLVSTLAGPPALFGWATGSLPEPKNNPQIGMANMRAIMPALQKSKPASLQQDGLRYLSVSPPQQRRQTRIVKDQSPDDIAADLMEWISQH